MVTHPAHQAAIPPALLVLYPIMLRVDTLPSPQPLQADFTHPSPDVVRAYSVCRIVENLIDQDRPLHNDTMNTKLIDVRILGHLLSQSSLLLDTAISKVADDVLSSQANTEGSNEALLGELTALGEFYRNYLIRPCKCQATRTRFDVSDAASIQFANTRARLPTFHCILPETHSSSRRGRLTGFLPTLAVLTFACREISSVIKYLSHAVRCSHIVYTRH